jgi:hypothetical protein
MSVTYFDTLEQPNGPDFDVYSPDIFDDVMYMGGWLYQGNRGEDQLYQSVVGVDAPTPLNWVAPSGYHINDPSVIRLSTSKLLMYATALPDQYATPIAMTHHNTTGLVVSYDDGASWFWHGIAIGQSNGLDNTGAWSPSALETAAGPVVWYNTNGIPTIYRSTMTADGAQVISTTTCIDVDTGTALSAANVSIKFDSSDGLYWMVGNDYRRGFNLVAYKSTDGINWTAWSGNGDPTFMPGGGVQLFTPTIASIIGSNMLVIYSEKLSTQTIERQITLNLSDPSVPNFLVSTPETGVTNAEMGDTYIGPVAGLSNQIIQITSQNLNVSALTDNVFIHTGAGEDAVQVIGGTNVLDGGTGSNFLIGGTGNDTFFVDDRAASSDIWSTVVNCHSNDAATIWGVSPLDSNLAWTDSQGAAGYTGLTLHATAPGRPNVSLTLAGYSTADINNGRLTISFGTDPASGNSYVYVHGN